MNDTYPRLTEIEAKLDAILAALNGLLAVAPRPSAEWYQAQTEAGQREVPTANHSPAPRRN